MPRTDLLQQSMPRVELDQRSRDARLRLECVERVLAVYPLPRSSLLRRFFRCLYWRTREGGQIEGPVSLMWTRRQETPRDQQTAGNGGRAGGYPKGSPAALPNCPEGARIGPGRSGRRQLNPGETDLPWATRIAASQGVKPWAHWCGRGDLNSHVLSDNRF
jgi:hypothetical protein